MGTSAVQGVERGEGTLAGEEGAECGGEESVSGDDGAEGEGEEDTWVGERGRIASLSIEGRELGDGDGDNEGKGDSVVVGD